MGSLQNMKTAIVCLLMTMALSGCGGGGGGGSASTPIYPPPAVIFSDSFADDTGWVYVDETGSGLAIWGVVGGVLRQTGHLEISGVDETLLGTTSYHLGTYACLDSPAMNGVSNYRFSVDITPLTNNDGGRSEGNDVGIMFGYQDRTTTIACR